MVNYVCIKCGNSFNRKSNYDYHVNVSRKCKQETVESLMEKMDELRHEKDTMLLLVKTKDDDYQTLKTEHMTEIELLNSEHHKEIERLKNEHEANIERLKSEHKDEASRLQFEHDKVRIVSELKDHGTDYDIILKNSEWKHLLSDIPKCIYNIVKYVHFDKIMKHRNIYIDDKKEYQYIHKYKNKDWIKVDQKSTLKDMINSIMDDIDIVISDTSEFDKKNITKFLNNYRQDKQLRKNILEGVREVTVNGSFVGDDLFWIYNDKYRYIHK